jgi:hypothetical protein
VLRREISAAKQFSAKHEVDNQLYFGLVLDDKTKGFGIATLTRSRIFACSDFRSAKRSAGTGPRFMPENLFHQLDWRR